MNEQTGRIGSVQLENTPRWIADELLELSRRLDVLEAAQRGSDKPAPTPSTPEGDGAEATVPHKEPEPDEPDKSWYEALDTIHELEGICAQPSGAARDQLHAALARRLRHARFDAHQETSGLRKDLQSVEFYRDEWKREAESRQADMLTAQHELAAAREQVSSLRERAAKALQAWDTRADATDEEWENEIAPEIRDALNHIAFATTEPGQGEPKCSNPYCKDGWVAVGKNESGAAPPIPCEVCRVNLISRPSQSPSEGLESAEKTFEIMQAFPGFDDLMKRLADDEDGTTNTPATAWKAGMEKLAEKYAAQQARIRELEAERDGLKAVVDKLPRTAQPPPPPGAET